MKDKWIVLEKVDIEDLPDRSINIKITYKRSGLVNIRIAKEEVKMFGRSSSIIYNVIKNTGGILQKEVLQSLKESWRIYNENSED